MPNIRVDLNRPIYDGQTVTFKSPADCSEVTGLIIYYFFEGEVLSKIFQFADAHGNNVGSVSLFAEDVLVKVILDTELERAYVQNADTNKYIEETFLKKVVKPVPRRSHIDDIKEPGFYTLTIDESGLPFLVANDTYYLEVVPIGQSSVKQVIDSSEGIATRKLIDEVWSEWEWVNPALHDGVEYRTTERYQGYPVYIMKKDGGAMPSSGVDISVTFPDKASIIEYDVYSYTKSNPNNSKQKLPMFNLSTGAVMASARTILNKVTIRGFASNGDYNFYVIVKYTK